MKKSFVLFLLAGFMLQSCMTYYANYNVGLSSVESPEVAKKQIGEVKIENYKVKKTAMCSFEDDFIDVHWQVTATTFDFRLKNKSGKLIKINWDDASYVDIKGNVGRVMHNGVRYIVRNESQPMITIPKGTTLSDLLLPTNNVYFKVEDKAGSFKSSWKTQRLIPSTYKSLDAYYTSVDKYIGARMMVLLPMIVDDTQYYYTFVFEVKELS